MSNFEDVVEILHEINGNLLAVHNSIKRQTELIVRMADKPKEDPPKEAAPAPKEITWQEAVNALSAYCCTVPCTKCEAIGWCRDFRQKHPCSWYIPDTEKKEG